MGRGWMNAGNREARLVASEIDDAGDPRLVKAFHTSSSGRDINGIELNVADCGAARSMSVLLVFPLVPCDLVIEEKLTSWTKGGLAPPRIGIGHGKRASRAVNRSLWTSLKWAKGDGFRGPLFGRCNRGQP